MAAWYITVTTHVSETYTTLTTVSGTVRFADELDTKWVLSARRNGQEES